MAKVLNIPQTLQTVFKYVDAHKDDYVAALKEAVSFKSVSSSPNRREDCVKMMRWTEKYFRKLGAETELCGTGTEEIPGGETIKLAPVLIASFGKKSNNKKTVCIYGHMDVQPVKKDDWETDPFTLEEKEGKLYGRGVFDNKGPCLGWLHAIEAYQVNKLELPVNAKFVFECMEEVGSPKLGNFLVVKKPFFKDVDYVCVSDGTWATPKKPSIIYATRGMIYLSIEVEGLKKDLHSGTYGGLVHEPLADLLFLMNSLQDHNGKNQIPDWNEHVLQVTPEEETLYDSISFDVEALRKDIGAPKLAHKEDKSRLLMHRWRFPTLSYHGIEGAYSEPGGRTIIPAKVAGKVSMRLVQHQLVEPAFQMVQAYLQKVFKLRKSPNTLRVKQLASAHSWSDNPMTPHYKAAMRAVKNVYKVEPDLTREGGSVAICPMIREITEGKSLLVMPISGPYNNAHGSNEKLDRKQYIEGIKVMASYLYEVSLI